MASYFDEDLLSEDNDFDSVSASSNEDEEDLEQNPKKIKLITTEKDLEDDEDLDQDLDIQYGGVDDLDLDQDPDPEDQEEEDDEDDQDELNEENINKVKKLKTIPDNVEYEDEEEVADGENYLKKFDKEINKNYIMNFHPECISHNYDEVESLTKIVRNKNNIIIDDFHKTLPYLTKYERTRIIGQRAKQINAGGTAFVKVPENVIDGYLIAELELKEKRIPFIIRRPLPNGGSEYWNVRDLENIAF
jgi:DNA-directed RNA polymerase I, II, and III subunit RPABC2